MRDHAVGFDRDLYINLQSKHIRKRREAVGGRLYMEMGGKLFDDLHASRVLPGFTPDNKIAMLETIKDEMEILVCISARDLQRNKMRADLDIPYEEDVLRLIDVFRERGFLAQHVVLTQYEEGDKAADAFRTRLERLGMTVSLHYVIPGYPADTERIVSDEGFGRNEYVPISRDVVVVTAPGPGSGKLATCLSHLLSEMEVTADRLVIIGKGRLIGEWNKQELLNGHANLEEAYWSVASGHAEYGASETAVA